VEVVLSVFVAVSLRNALARSFQVVTAILAVSLVCFVLSVAVDDPQDKVYLTTFRMGPYGFVPIASLAFVYRMTGVPRAQSLFHVWLLSVVPAITLVLALVSPYHHWLRTDVTVDPVTHLASGRWGPWFPVHAANAYIAMVLCFVALYRSARRSSAPFRQQQWLALWALVPTPLADLLFSFGVTPIPGYNISVALTALSWFGFAYALIRYRFLDISPVARHQVVELVRDLVLVIDPQGRLVDLNRSSESVLGLRATDVIGQPAAKVVPKLVAHIEGDTSPPELSLMVAGQERSYAVTTSPLHDSGKAPVGRVLLLHDVTEIKQRADAAQEQARRLEQLDRAKDAFLSTVSHELRTPLNSIIGLTDVLLDEELTAELRQYVETMHDSGEMLLSLVNDLLDLAKIRAGKVELLRVPFSVLSTVESVLRVCAIDCERKGLELSCYVPPDVPLLLGDAERVRRILLNLVGNAVKFTQHGEVRVAVSYERVPASRLVISVADTGPGIPADKRELVFEEFTRLEDATTRAATGTGLGLPIVRQMARLMGGDVSLHENPGGGSVFSVTLALGEGAPVLPTPFAGHPAVVLCVEHPLRRQHLVDSLRYEGCNVIEVRDLRAATGEVERRRFAPPDAVVIDVDGVTPAVIRDSSLPELLRDAAPFSILVALDSTSLMRDAQEYRMLGVRELLTRPYLLKDVRQSLEVVLSHTARPRRQSLAPRIPVPGVRPRRILAADDNPDNLALLRAYLKNADVETDYVVDGDAALQRFREKRYDIVFLDIEMPVVDGYATVRQMRDWEHDERQPPTPIIAMTAHAGPEHHGASTAAGFTHHLDKPCRKQDFLQVLTRFAPPRPSGAGDPQETRSAEVAGQRFAN
jgi:PAS domain S-box-containing protein